MQKQNQHAGFQPSCPYLNHLKSPGTEATPTPIGPGPSMAAVQILDKSTQQAADITSAYLPALKVKRNEAYHPEFRTHQSHPTPPTLSSSPCRTVKLYHPPETLVHTNAHPIPIMQSAHSPSNIDSTISPTSGALVRISLAAVSVQTDRQASEHVEIPRREKR